MADKDKKLILERFGRYLLLDHLVDGGMAKICRARFLSKEADKIVAIKMVQPKYSQDESFRKMFMDEIKVTFGLLHPNIIQTYDYGLHKDQLYVAMEYCDGRNLKEYLEKLKQKKFVFPVEISIYIITQVCQALHYAHTFTDKLSGKKSNIIHRDISPHNIMLSYDGAVKVIDFGIAKSTKNTEATQAGTIKGKLSYLAPEYLEGNELDARYDQFAVGITLWEMLCSRKLFKAANDLAVLKLIQECKIPAPSTINPNVPEELDQIVLKALSKDRNKRYENLDQLNRALMKFLYVNYPDFNATDLSYFAKELFKEEIKKDRARLYEYGKIDLTPYIDGHEEIAQTPAVPSPTKESVGGRIKKEQVLDFGFEEDTKEGVKLSGEEGKTNLRVKAHTRMTKSIGLSDGKTRTKLRSGIHEGMDRTGTHTGIQNLTKKKSKGKLIPFAVALAFVFGLFGYQGFLKEWPFFEKSNETRVPSSNNIDKKEDSTKQSTHLVLLKNVDRHKHKVFINGEEIDIDFLGRVKLPYDQEVVLRVQKPGKEHFVARVIASREAPMDEYEVLDTPDARYGFLTTSRPCVFGKLKFNLFGEDRVADLPFEKGFRLAFPVLPGNDEHTLYYQVAGEDIERKINLHVQEDRNTDFCDLEGVK